MEIIRKHVQKGSQFIGIKCIKIKTPKTNQQTKLSTNPITNPISEKTDTRKSTCQSHAVCMTTKKQGRGKKLN
jgi:hypothetical protein